MGSSVVVRSRTVAATEGGKSFIACTGALSGDDNYSSDALFIAGTGKICRLHKITISSTDQRLFEMYHTPTVSNNGTAITPTNLRIGKGATAVGKLYKNPTVDPVGTAMFSHNSGKANPLIQELFENPIILHPAVMLFYRSIGESGSQTVSYTFEWDEETI